MNTRRVILVRPERTGRVFVRPTDSNNTPPVAHPSTRGVCVGGAAEEKNASRTQACEVGTDTLLAQIAALPAEQQKVLLDRVAASHLLTASKPSERDLGLWAAAVYQAFCKAVGGPGAAGVGPLVFKKLLAATAVWQPVERFMLSTGLDQERVTDRNAIYVLLADMLVKHARRVARHTDVPLSPKFVAACAANVAGLFDKAFPGYIEAGLAHVVARQFHVPVERLHEV